jgi:hypothetical protein
MASPPVGWVPTWHALQPELCQGGAGPVGAIQAPFIRDSNAAGCAGLSQPIALQQIPQAQTIIKLSLPMSSVPLECSLVCVQPGAHRMHNI